MARIIIADLKGKGGFVNKDTIAGGYGSRFHGYSKTTRIALVLRRVFYNIPSITVGHLASIFASAGHEVVVTTFVEMTSKEAHSAWGIHA